MHELTRRRAKEAHQETWYIGYGNVQSALMALHLPGHGLPAAYGAGMKLCIKRGWLVMHESGTYVKFTPAGADLSHKKTPSE
jgi:hypothetical protein